MALSGPSVFAVAARFFGNLLVHHGNTGAMVDYEEDDRAFSRHIRQIRCPASSRDGCRFRLDSRNRNQRRPRHSPIGRSLDRHKDLATHERRVQLSLDVRGARSSHLWLGWSRNSASQLVARRDQRVDARRRPARSPDVGGRRRSAAVRQDQEQRPNRIIGYLGYTGDSSSDRNAIGPARPASNLAGCAHSTRN